MMRVLWLFVCIMFIGCSASWHLKQAKKKDATLFENTSDTTTVVDTLYFTDSVVINDRIVKVEGTITTDDVNMEHEVVVDSSDLDGAIITVQDTAGNIVNTIKIDKVGGEYVVNVTNQIKGQTVSFVEEVQVADTTKFKRLEIQKNTTIENTETIEIKPTFWQRFKYAVILGCLAFFIFCVIWLVRFLQNIFKNWGDE